MQLNWLDNPTPKRLSSGFPEKMVLLDCETTGGKATYHRIIEIGLLIIDNGELIETWQTFVDPEMALPPFIQRLTGIRPEMLDGAPLFADIASELVNRLEGRTLVAHNARFDYGFLKNEYILNLNELIMTRNYVYNEKTYQKYKVTDLSVKKKNSYVRNIYEEDGKILTLKHGYPQFYTQILFKKDKPEIFVKAVLNDVESLSKISTCKKIEKFDQQS